MTEHERISLLWALRSPCDLRCTYCYFGTLDAKLPRPRSIPLGTLSHVSDRDVEWSEIERFAGTVYSDTFADVFIAGGEPLIYPQTRRVVAKLVECGPQVTICTNGMPLIDQSLRAWALESGIHRLSVSLDSSDPILNDRYRVNPRGSWADIVTAIQKLIDDRAGARYPQIGVYSVATRANLDQLEETVSFVDSLGVDFHVVQPVSLAYDHPLHAELALDQSHLDILHESLSRFQTTYSTCRSLDADYLSRLGVLGFDGDLVVNSCFAGRSLLFIQPDGQVWGCPSQAKIASVGVDARRSIIGADATSLARSMQVEESCGLFSTDCVNMWQLVSFKKVAR